MQANIGANYRGVGRAHRRCWRAGCCEGYRCRQRGAPALSLKASLHRETGPSSPSTGTEDTCRRITQDEPWKSEPGSHVFLSFFHSAGLCTMTCAASGAMVHALSNSAQHYIDYFRWFCTGSAPVLTVSGGRPAAHLLRGRGAPRVLRGEPGGETLVALNFSNMLTRTETGEEHLARPGAWPGLALSVVTSAPGFERTSTCPAEPELTSRRPRTALPTLDRPQVLCCSFPSVRKRTTRIRPRMIMSCAPIARSMFRNICCVRQRVSPEPRCLAAA